MKMTIETRLSFPKGGEYPPQESIGQSPVSSSASNENKNSSSNCCKYRKKEPVSIAKRNKIRNQKQKMFKATKCKDESSEPNSSTSDAGKEICSKSSGSSSSECMPGVSTKNEKGDDLKKTCKANKHGVDGSKEDPAASRKSMRLRLRKGRDDYSSYAWLIPKERPRYVENLTEIDFNDENVKIMFMDALGMCPRPRTEKVKPEPDCSNCNESIITNQNESESNDCINKEMEISVGCADTTISEDKKGELVDILQETSPEIEKHSEPLPMIFNVSSSSSEAYFTQSHCESMETDDDGEDWEVWVKRIPVAHTSRQTSQEPSPSKKEINESLKLLIKLGTEVKLNVSSI